MNIKNNKNKIIIEGTEDFSLEQTLECGQCFRFEKLADDNYAVVHKKRLVNVLQEKKNLIFIGSCMEDVENIWIPYFDLNRDYSKIKRQLLKDKKLAPAIEEKWGVRLLNQEFYETLISYIISQNKQIPHIKKIIKDMSEKYGQLLGSIEGKKYYSFPDIKTLSKIGTEGFKELKTGFRAAYLEDAALKLYSGEISEDMFKDLSYEKAKEKLKEIKGVGDKVANCVLLFSLGYRHAFPVDVWIKRIMEELYFDGKETDKDVIEKTAADRFGEYSGYAQQYLFCYGREHGIGK